MSQQVLGFVGAVVGGVIGTYTTIGTTYGAELGYALGSGIGAIAFPPNIRGPHVRSLLAQSAAYGTPLPIAYGNCRIVPTLIWQLPIQEVGTSQGGKGGGASITSYAYFGTFAVALCDCAGGLPITGVRRVWANGILVYDVSSTATPATLINSNEFAGQYMTVYLGTLTQNPDPTMQAALGAGNVPGYRGTAYIVFRNLPLVNYGNLLPSINVEITTATAGNAPVKVWENDATGFHFIDGSRAVFVTGFANGSVRSIAKTFSTIASNDGTAYRLNLTDGTTVSPDIPTNFENTISSGAAYFRDPYGNGMVLTCPSHGSSCGVYMRGPGAITLSPQGSNAAAGLWTSNYTTGHVDQDVLACLTKPAGITGVWTFNAAFPCADWQHVGVITSDATGTGNVWLHVVAFTDLGACSEVAYYLFTTPGDFVHTGNVNGSWLDPFNYWAPGTAMLESSLNSYWASNGFFGVPEASYYKVDGATNQVVMVGQLNYTIPTPTSHASIFADNGVMVYEEGNRAHCISASQLGAATTVPLSSIVTDIAERAGIASGSINATALTDGVWGFIIDRQMTARAAFEAIAPALWFDAVESDGALKFVHRSASPVATITLDDMGADTTGKNNASPLAFVRGSEIELPSEIDLTYYALGGDYQPGVQYARRLIGIESNNVVNVDTGTVMDDTQAAVAAAIILWDTIAGRISFKFSTSYKLSTGTVPAGQLEPTDIITIQTANEAYLARINRKTENGGKIDWECVACAPVYSQAANGGAITAGQIVSGVISTIAVIMDIPPLRDQDGTGSPNLYVAMYGPGVGWPGGGLFKSSDGGASFIAGITMGTPATVGRATNVLGNWTGGNVFDECSIVTVTVLSGQTLSGTTALGVLNGSNAALIGAEILQFKNATLVSTNTYQLSGFLRGRFATEAGMATHAVGETFVLLSPPAVIAAQSTPTSDIGAPRIYDAVTIGQPLPTGAQQTITEKGKTLVCFAPVLLNAGGSGYYNDIILTWTRRNRITWQWLDAVDEPMSETIEQYLVSIFNGPTVVRTFTVTAATTGTYTLAQQITDFGMAGLTSVTFGVQQISAVTGPGNMAKATIALAPNASLVTYTKALSTSVGTSAVLGLGFVHPLALSASVGTNASLVAGSSSGSLALLHLDGTNGSTTFTDVYGNIWTGQNSAALSTTQAKFGTASLGCTNNKHITTPDAAQWAFAGDFTVEFFFYCNSLPGAFSALCSKIPNGGSIEWVLIQFNTSNQIQTLCTVPPGGWGYNVASGVISSGQWYHIAMVRSGGTITSYLNGVSFGSGVLTGTVQTDTTPLSIGGDSVNIGQAFDGFIDEVRISNVARYTSNFTPPSAPFPF
jgi:hypothetical protein